MNVRRKLLIIFVLALVVRVALAFHLGNDLPVDHGQIASLKNILAGHGFSETVPQADGTVQYIPTARDLPGHGLIIMATWILTGSDSLLPIQILQIILDALMIFFVFGIGWELCSEKVGLLAALLFAIYLPEAYLAVLARRDVWVSFGTITSFYCLVRYLKMEQWKHIIWVGIILAWTAYFRSTIVLLPVAFGFVMAFYKGWRKVIAPTLTILAVILIALFPWGIRNHYAVGKFLLAELNFYQSMWEGFGQFPNPVSAVNNDVLTEKQMREAGYTGRFASLAYEEFLKPKVESAIREHPLWYLGTVVKRIPRALLINKVPWGVFQKNGLEFHTFHLKEGGEMSLVRYGFRMLQLNPGLIVTKVFDGLILLGALLGLWQWWRLDRKSAFLLVTLPVYFITTLIPIRMEGRYLVPIHWVYLLFFSYFITGFCNRREMT